MKKVNAVLLAILILLFAGCGEKFSERDDGDHKPVEQKEVTVKDSDEGEDTQKVDASKTDISEPVPELVNPPDEPSEPESTNTSSEATEEETSPKGKNGLLDLDNSKQGYGQGIHVDENNRPIGALDMQKKYGNHDAIFIGEMKNNIYLTFDEGYENGFTAQILDVLKEKNCSAVFFITMPYAKSNPELVKRMIDEGHVLGNHSVSHLSMPTLTVEKATAEIMNLHEYIKETYNYEMYLFRPPMGEFSERTLELTSELGYKTMLWSFAYMDYDTSNQPEIEAAYERVTGAHHKGAVYLLHAISETNTKILGRVIDDFRQKGYTVGAYTR